jgi:large subunit ribosomal protein L28
MARKCPITGKGVQVGHNVSHSNIKTKRRFLPNLQTISMLSDAIGPVRLRLSTAAIRTIEFKGGIDAFLKGSRDSKLSPEIRRLKRRIMTAAAARPGGLGTASADHSAAARSSGPRARSTRGFTSPIINSIERIAAACGVLPTLNEKQM